MDDGTAFGAHTTALIVTHISSQRSLLFNKRPERTKYISLELRPRLDVTVEVVGLSLPNNLATLLARFVGLASPTCGSNLGCVIANETTGRLGLPAQQTTGANDKRCV